MSNLAILNISFTLSYLSGWSVGWCKKYTVALYPGSCGRSSQTSTRQQCFWSGGIQRAARSLCRHRWSTALKDYSTNRCCSGPLSLSPWFREGQRERKCTHLLVCVWCRRRSMDSAVELSPVLCSGLFLSTPDLRIMKYFLLCFNLHPPPPRPPSLWITRL